MLSRRQFIAIFPGLFGATWVESKPYLKPLEHSPVGCCGLIDSNKLRRLLRAAGHIDQQTNTLIASPDCSFTTESLGVLADSVFGLTPFQLVTMPYEDLEPIYSRQTQCDFADRKLEIVDSWVLARTEVSLIKLLAHCERSIQCGRSL